MRVSAVGRALVVAACVFVVSGWPAHAQTPSLYAIRDARIVPVVGAVVERGTIVIDRGVIVAVGADAVVPRGAEVIDGSGLTVYPGLFDAMTDVGLAQPGPPRGAGGPQASPQTPAPRPATQGPQARPASTPWVEAAHEVNADDRRLATWRAGGVTTAHVAPGGGILPGQGAVINLAPGPASQTVVRTPVSLAVTFQPQRGGFPGSLMGVIAYLRQVILDARHHAADLAAYNVAPRGRPRPTYDRTAATVAEAIGSHRPVLLPAVTAVQVGRALDLAKEFDLRPVIVGAHEGYAIAERIKDAGAVVVVSVKWPEATRDADPEAIEPLRTLRLRDRAPSTPARLHEAGVTFAFSSDGLASPREFVRGVARAVDRGLPADAALRALTLSPAEIFGVADRLGSLERGKIANLVITDGDLFEDATRITHVFVDGVPVDIAEPAQSGPPAPASTPIAGVAGTWTLDVSTPTGSERATATLAPAADGSLTGTVTSSLGTSAISSGSVDGATFRLTFASPMGPADLTGEVAGDSVRGTFALGSVSGTFTGTRTAPPGRGPQFDQEGRR